MYKKINFNNLREIRCLTHNTSDLMFFQVWLCVCYFFLNRWKHIRPRRPDTLLPSSSLHRMPNQSPLTPAVTRYRRWLHFHFLIWLWPGRAAYRLKNITLTTSTGKCNFKTTLSASILCLKCIRHEASMRSHHWHVLFVEHITEPK